METCDYGHIKKGFGRKPVSFFSDMYRAKPVLHHASLTKSEGTAYDATKFGLRWSFAHPL